MLIDEIRMLFASRIYEYSLHAVDQSILRRISVEEVEQAVAVGEIIDRY